MPSEVFAFDINLTQNTSQNLTKNLTGNNHSEPGIFDSIMSEFTSENQVLQDNQIILENINSQINTQINTQADTQINNFLLTNSLVNNKNFSQPVLNLLASINTTNITNNNNLDLIPEQLKSTFENLENLGNLQPEQLDSLKEFFNPENLKKIIQSLIDDNENKFENLNDNLKLLTKEIQDTIKNFINDLVSNTNFENTNVNELAQNVSDIFNRIIQPKQNEQQLQPSQQSQQSEIPQNVQPDSKKINEDNNENNESESQITNHKRKKNNEIPTDENINFASGINTVNQNSDLESEFENPDETSQPENLKIKSEIPAQAQENNSQKIISQKNNSDSQVNQNSQNLQNLQTENNENNPENNENITSKNFRNVLETRISERQKQNNENSQENNSQNNQQNNQDLNNFFDSQNNSRRNNNFNRSNRSNERSNEISRSQNYRANSSREYSRQTNDFQTFFEGVLNNRRTLSNSQTTPLNLGTNLNLSQSQTLNTGISNVVRFIRADGLQKANIIIDPPALGRISIELTSTSAGVEASVKVTSEQIRQLVQEQISELRLNLSRQGVQVTEFSVDVQQDNSQQQQQNSQQHSNRFFWNTNSFDDDEIQSQDFRIDLDQGLLYWVA